MQFLLNEKEVTKTAYWLIGFSSLFGVASLIFYFALNNLLCVITLIIAIALSISCAVLTSKHAIATKDEDCLLASLRSGFGAALTAINLIFLIFSLLTNLSDTVFQTFSILLLLLLIDLLVIETELIKKSWFLAISILITMGSAATYYIQYFLLYKIIYLIIGLVLILLSIRNIKNHKYVYFSTTVCISEILLILITLLNLQFAGYFINCIEFLSFNFMLIGAIKFTNGIKE